jgi:SPP1 family predicted phage head-tail adaptor
MAKVEIQAGELNTWITFQRCTKVPDSTGQRIETWADAATVPAAKMTTGGKEYIAAQKKNAETTAVFKIRYTQAVNERMRIKQGNHIFEILPPLNDVDNKHIVLLIPAKEVT